jgi:hypothetical protein
LKIDPRYKYERWVKKHRGYPKKIEELYIICGNFGPYSLNTVDGEPSDDDYAKVNNMIPYQRFPMD